MDDALASRIATSLDALTAAVNELRADLKRREKRDLENTGQIPRTAAPQQQQLPSAGGAVFPPYGKKKGEPVTGAAMGDLEYYRAGCMRTLGDSSKSRWHDKERVLLAAIDAEIARQTGSGNKPGPQEAVDSFWPEAPPPTDEDAPF